jgi:hypothetical protein
MLDLDWVALAKRPAARAARGLVLAKLGNLVGANVEVDDAVAEASLSPTLIADRPPSSRTWLSTIIRKLVVTVKGRSFRE